MRSYPAYRIEDFYRKSYLEGGVTYTQVIKLYEYQMRDQEDQWKFHAAIHGIDLDAKPEETEESGSAAKPTQDKQFLFKDPATYEGMSEEERTKETQKMMSYWRPFALHSSPRQ